jgi:hypothetical protein
MESSDERNSYKLKSQLHCDALMSRLRAFQYSVFAKTSLFWRLARRLRLSVFVRAAQASA